MRKLRIHYFQHVSFEGLACIEQWINQKKHQLSGTRFYLDDELPEIDDLDWLIVMGGPMGVNDEEIYQWLKYEKEFIKKAIDAGKTVIGICLGAQLIASALNTKVYPNKFKEIGWFEVAITPQGFENKLFGDFNEKFPVFHWHGDTFDIPNNAQHIFQSEACKNQCFTYQNKVLGLQFHFEVTEESLNEMILNGKHELVKDKYIQTGNEMLAQKDYIKANNKLMFKVLDSLYVDS
jgi:GMP synthase-like glutamine amidotransferase